MNLADLMRGTRGKMGVGGAISGTTATIRTYNNGSPNGLNHQIVLTGTWQIF